MDLETPEDFEDEETGDGQGKARGCSQQCKTHWAERCYQEEASVPPQPIGGIYELTPASRDMVAASKRRKAKETQSKTGASALSRPADGPDEEVE